MTTDGAGQPNEAVAAAADSRQSLLRSWSLVATWIEVFADIKALLAAEVATAKLEAGDNARFFGAQAAKLAVAALLLMLMLVLLVAAAVVWLAGVIGTLAALLAVAGGCLLLAAVLGLSGAGGLGRRSLLPKDSIGRIGRDLRQIAGAKVAISAAEGDRHESE